MKFAGKVPRNNDNMRTEFAWMVGLDADHQNIAKWELVNDYDNVFLILPKLNTSLNAVGANISKIENPSAVLYDPRFVEHLKTKNKKVFIIQEGPSWLFNDYEIQQQFGYINSLPIHDIPSLMIEDSFAHNDIIHESRKRRSNNRR